MQSPGFYSHIVLGLNSSIPIRASSAAMTLGLLRYSRRFQRNEDGKVVGNCRNSSKVHFLLFSLAQEDYHFILCFPQNLPFLLNPAELLGLCPFPSLEL